MKLMDRSETKEGGFTLIEVLAALALFSLAMLGIALFTGNAIKTSINDSVRGIALYTANNEIEKLVVAAGLGAPNLRAALLAFDTDVGAATFSREVLANNGKDRFIVAITAASDFNGVNVLTDASPALWVSPITLAVRVSYKEANNIAARASYTISEQGPDTDPQAW